MAKLAIKGHETRGKEVIEIFEMLGGNNTVYDLDGLDENAYYYIHHDYIDCDNKDMIGKGHPEFKHYTIEEFLEKFPYKIGDKAFAFGNKCTIINAVWDGGIDEVVYIIKLYTSKYTTTKLSNQLQPYKEETKVSNLVVEEDYKKTLEIEQIARGNLVELFGDCECSEDACERLYLFEQHERDLYPTKEELLKSL